MSMPVIAGLDSTSLLIDVTCLKQTCDCPLETQHGSPSHQEQQHRIGRAAYSWSTQSFKSSLATSRWLAWLSKCMTATHVQTTSLTS